MAPKIQSVLIAMNSRSGGTNTSESAQAPAVSIIRIGRHSILYFHGGRARFTRMMTAVSAMVARATWLTNEILQGNHSLVTAK